MSSVLRLAFSPCPNDTFMFHAWVHGLLPGAPAVVVELADIDELNHLAVRGVPDVVKLSFPAFAVVCKRYVLLRSGGALGRGCGPLIVARPGCVATDAVGGLESATVAIPGELTTAAFLLDEYAPHVGARVAMRFDDIMPAVRDGVVDAGVIIHESRFTYPGYGLEKVVDLGEWWEEETGLPMPLGGIAARRTLTRPVALEAEKAIQRSIEYAWRHPEESGAFVTGYAQEMAAEVCKEHIGLYVNNYSLEYGAEGEEAIRLLLTRARKRVGVADASQGVFLGE